jgi:hypothetical protein
MMKIVSAVCASSLCFIGIAHADMNRYKACVNQAAGGALVASQADQLAGVMTYETYRVFGGGDKEKPVHDQIQQNCEPHLGDADKVMLIQQASEVLGQRNRSAKANPEQLQTNTMAALSSVAMAVQPTVQKTVSNGQLVTWGTSDRMKFQYLEVVKSTVNSIASAFLVFQETAFDPNSQVCVTDPDPSIGTVCHYSIVYYDLAAGDIPAADILATAKTAWLKTDITNNANFVYKRCIVDDVAGTTVCTAVPPTGVIRANFIKTPDNYYKYSGTIETKTGPQIVKTTGTREEYSATVTGSTLGWPVSSSSALFGVTNSVGLTTTLP